MGDTFDDIVKLFILDILYSLLEEKEYNKIVNSKNVNLDSLNNLNLNTHIKLFSHAVFHNQLNNNEIIMIEIITKQLNMIFGVDENKCLEFIYNLFSNKDDVNLNLKLIKILRNSNLKLVKL